MCLLSLWVLIQERTWILLHRNPGTCDESCRTALYTYRQARLMLGKEMDRVQRVFLHGDSPPDTVFLAEEHPGLITIEDSDLDVLLNNKRPAELPAGGYYLVDPIGNLVMYFQPDLDPGEMVDDIKHLFSGSNTVNADYLLAEPCTERHHAFEHQFLAFE